MIYRLVNTEDNGEIGRTEAPVWIRKHSNGCFVACGEDEAEGIAFHGTPYNLPGHEMEGAAGTAVAFREDPGDELDRQQGQLESASAFLYSDQYKRWDGLKWVYDPANPIPLLRFPFPVEENAIYRTEDGVRYVGVKAGSVTEETLEEYLEPYELGG